MEKLLPPTFLNGRYRLDRLVVAHDDVTIWKATDVARGLPVQLSIFEHGSAVLHSGRSEGGMFVAIDSSSRPHLELAAGDDEEEESISLEPKVRRRRAWPWAAAGVACALIAAGGWYVSRAPSQPVASETTITAAEIPAVVATTPPPPAPTVVPVEAPVLAAPTVTAPVAAPEHRTTTVPRAKPQLPKPSKPRTPSPAATSYDPLTI